jgi:hypothetical protein
MANRSLANRAAAYSSWGKTVDRSARTANARKAGPGSLDHWLGKLDPERFANATETQRRDAAIAMKRAHFASLAAKSAKARNAKSPTPNQGAGLKAGPADS